MTKKKFQKYQQSVFNPVNKEKYKGSTPIIARSSWELKLMQYLDRNSNCISWGSESAVVRYTNPMDHQIHRYFIDFTAVFRDRHGELKKYYIEVKPYKQTLPPTQTKNKKPSTLLHESETYVKNQAKWKAARDWAKTKDAQFIILTEKELFTLP